MLLHTQAFNRNDFRERVSVLFKNFVILMKTNAMGTIEIRELLHKYIDKAADAQVEAIYTLLEDKVEAVQDRATIEQYNKEIEDSEQEYESGNYITHSEFIKEMKKW